MRHVALFIIAVAAGSTRPVAAVQQAPAYDIVIKHGLILDGTGNPFYVADVGIRGERIAEIGTIDAARARRVIDARGLYDTPWALTGTAAPAIRSDRPPRGPPGRFCP